MTLPKQGNFSFTHATQLDKPNMTSTQLKAAFDSQGSELKTTINAIVDALEKITSTSGSAQIGSEAITDIAGATIRDQLVDFRNKLKSVVDGSSGADFVNATGINALTGSTVQALLESLKDYIDTHKTSADHDGRYFTESELQSTVAGSSGASKVGSSTINGSIAAGTIFEQLTAIYSQIQNVVLNQIPDGTVTNAKLNPDIKIGSLAGLTTTSKNDLISAINEIQQMPTFSVTRQAVINSGFSINQRVKSGTVTLAAGAYGHDRWKAGAGGCTYTFSTANNVTTITITAGSLVQVIDGVNLYSGTYMLSWTGTAQGKIGAGAYGATGITGAVVGGANLSIEFNVGTISQVQFNFGSSAVPFQPRSFAEELALCQRYFQRLSGTLFRTPPSLLTDTAATVIQLPLKQTMRISPTVSLKGVRGTDWDLYSQAGSVVATGSLSASSQSKDYGTVYFTGGTYTAGSLMHIVLLNGVGSIDFDSEL